MNEISSHGGNGDHAVVVEGLRKEFRIPKHRVSTLKERALHPFRRTEYRHISAVNNVSFAVERGEFYGIVGRNGSGKSTLLKCLAGIYRVDRGSIGLRGRLSPFIELGVGFNPDLTARENVLINAIMLGLTPAQARERFDSVIDFAELHDFLDLKLKNYSSGMHVRLAFSVMIQVDADILLVDEILAVGDAAFQQKCFDAFHDLRAEGKTLLLVTHDMASVQRFCDRAMLLENGSLVEIGNPWRVSQLYHEINFRREFVEGETEAPGSGGLKGAEGEDTARYGSGAAQVVDAWFEDKEGRRSTDLSQGEACRFRTRVRFAEAMTDPVFAVAIENEKDVCVFATSTTWADVQMGTFAAGDEATVSLDFENVLVPGRYYCTPSLARQGGGQDMLDLRKRMASAVVYGTKATGGVVNLDHDIKIERSGAGAPVEGAVGE